MPETKLRLVMEVSIRSKNRDRKKSENEEENVRKNFLFFKLI